MSTQNPEEEKAGKYQPGRLVKSELTEAVAESIETSLREAAHFIDVIFDSIARALQRGERIELRGFGSFGIRDRRARIGRNPKTGHPVSVSPKRVAYFALSKRPAKTLNRP